jgi:hypothetical protein
VNGRGGGVGGGGNGGRDSGVKWPQDVSIHLPALDSGIVFSQLDTNTRSEKHKFV